MDAQDLRPILEAILFASDSSLTADELKDAFDGEISTAAVKAALSELEKEYESLGRGFALKEIAGGYQILTHERFSSHLKRFYQSREKKRLSPASLETLSVVAYKQPVTKADIEFVRGVNVDGPLRTLLEKNLIKIAGRKEVPGRPILYGTTKEFLAHFGLNSVKELPPLSEFSEKDIDQNLLPPQMRAVTHSEAVAEIEAETAELGSGIREEGLAEQNSKESLLSDKVETGEED